MFNAIKLKVMIFRVSGDARMDIRPHHARMEALSDLDVLSPATQSLPIMTTPSRNGEVPISRMNVPPAFAAQFKPNLRRSDILCRKAFQLLRIPRQPSAFFCANA